VLCVVRLLEEGKIQETDKKKDEVEEKQRERRKILAKKGEEHIPRFFRLVNINSQTDLFIGIRAGMFQCPPPSCRKSLDGAGREVWLYNGTYWKIRENPGFSNVKNLDLW